MLRAALLSLLLCGLPGCSSRVYVQANLQGYGLGAATAAQFHGFSWAPAPTSTNPLRDRTLGRLAAEALRARGLEDRGERPPASQDEFLMTVLTEIEETARYIPPQTRIVHSYRPGRTWRYRVETEGGGSQWVTVHDPGDWYPETWTTGGMTERVFTHRLTLRFEDLTGREVWNGTVSAVGPSGDILAVMRACVPLLLQEYPDPSGLPADRTVRVAPPQAASAPVQP
jgi:hypothetical protein